MVLGNLRDENLAIQSFVWYTQFIICAVKLSLNPNREIFVYNICVWWSYKKINSEYWKGHSKICPKEFESDVLNTFCATQELKTHNCTISPRMLHLKSQSLHQSLSFTSALNVWVNSCLTWCLRTMRKKSYVNK